MTTPTWTDRSLPLADRVRLAMLDWDMTDATEAHRAALLADVAAADELARAAEALDRLTRAPMGNRLIGKLPAAIVDRRDALAAYRARMAQGVDRGE